MDNTLTFPTLERAAPGGRVSDAAVPDAPGRRSRAWRLDSGGFEALLAALDPNRETAAAKYTALQERLSRFFAWNNAEDPDAQADEVLDRVTRRVATATNDDEAVRQPEKFAAGVARMLLREGWRAQKANVQMISAFQQRYSEQERIEKERRELEALSSLLEECLEELPAAQRELIRRYYSEESRAQIDGRKLLAEEFNISLNALRNRALRIRGEVERMARERLERRAL